MAAKSKRLSKIENKLLKLEKLQLKDVLCSICQSILVEPVTLPCYHDFCQSCFNGSIENNALCCPLCRLRIGSWIRTTTKQKNLVNTELWDFIKSKFSHEIDKKLKGEDISLQPEKPILHLSKPGEIRSEYEAELKRLRNERLQLEQKHYKETELLIQKVQEEEQEAHKRYLERLKEDEILAQKLQKQHLQSSSLSTSRKQSLKCTVKSKLRNSKIDGYLSKVQKQTLKESPLLTSDNSSTGSSSSQVTQIKTNTLHSPELVPSYGKFIKNFIDKKVKNVTGVWNKENGENGTGKKVEPQYKETESTETKSKKIPVTQSLPVSLPYTGVLQHKMNVIENRNLDTGSVDSMRQELCYFKPIEGTTPTSFSTTKCLPLRVPGLRMEKEQKPLKNESAPSRAQYIQGICQLRNLSLAQNLPSAFVIALNLLRVKKESPVKCETNTKSRIKKSTSPCAVSTLCNRKNTSNRNKQINQSDGMTKLNTETSLRRTRSMGSITKDENETTPKKAKINNRKVSSERKPYLRSDSKKCIAKRNEHHTPPLISESINNNKVNLAVKDLSSPLKNCDVKKILEDQLRIEKIIEQEKKDFELARKMEAEWNGRRQPRRTAGAVKRPVALNYSLRPAKKLKV